MKNSTGISNFTLALLLTVFLALSFVPILSYAEDLSVQVSSLKGTVSVKRAASEKSFAAFVGLKLKQGDVVTTSKNGEVVINIGDDKTIKGLSNSSFKISSLSGTNEDSQAGFTLIKGSVFNEVRKKQSSAKGLTVQTGNTVVGVRGTTYSVSLRATDGVTVHTLEGSVFWDKVRERIESDSNASLVTGQDIVEAGQGGNTTRDGTYELSMDDLTQAELEYITQNPQAFPEDMVNEATTLLDNQPEMPETPETEGPTQIVYEEKAPANTGGGGGGGGGQQPVIPPGYIGITNETDLLRIGTHVNYPLSDKYFLANDITLSTRGSDWTPIGSVNNPFTGEFDGNGKTISGLNGFNATAGALGLFGSVDSGAVVKDLTVGGTVNITTTGTDTYIGGITGYMQGGTIQDCINQVAITSPSNNATYFGGIVGYMEDGNITGCTNTGAINAKISGGIVGYAYGGTGTISSCINSGAIGSDNTGNAGGIVGAAAQASLTVSNCTGYADITSSSQSGGIVGYVHDSSVNVSQSAVKGGTIKASATISDGIAFAGGIIGNIHSITTGTHISECYVANTTINSSSSGGGNCQVFAGGILGESPSSNNTLIDNCFVSGTDVNATVSNASLDTSYIGGIAGHTPGDIKKCYVNDITLRNNVDSSYLSLGGIAGYAGTISECVTLKGTVGGTSGPPSDLGRIYHTCALTSSNNYGLYDTTTTTVGFYDGSGGYINSGSLTDNNGQDVGLAVTQLDSWWSSTLGWDFINTWDMQGNVPVLRRAP